MTDTATSTRTQETCHGCGVVIVREPGSIGTGVGVTSGGARICYKCCAVATRIDMVETGVSVLYLVEETARKEVTDWGGALRFPVTSHSHSKHGGGFGSQRTDVRFQGPDGLQWHGVNRGDSQILRCRRLAKQN